MFPKIRNFMEFLKIEGGLKVRNHRPYYESRKHHVGKASVGCLNAHSHAQNHPKCALNAVYTNTHKYNHTAM